jgi:hypothetical protein
LSFWGLGNKSTTRILKWWDLTTLECKLYLITEFQRLKEEEQKQLLGWTAKREYASEADVLNVVLLNKIAIQQMNILQDAEKRKVLK